MNFNTWCRTMGAITSDRYKRTLALMSKTSQLPKIHSNNCIHSYTLPEIAPKMFKLSQFMRIVSKIQSFQSCSKFSKKLPGSYTSPPIMGPTVGDTRPCCETLNWCNCYKNWQSYILLFSLWDNAKEHLKYGAAEISCGSFWPKLILCIFTTATLWFIFNGWCPTYKWKSITVSVLLSFLWFCSMVFADHKYYPLPAKVLNNFPLLLKSCCMTKYNNKRVIRYDKMW